MALEPPKAIQHEGFGEFEPLMVSSESRNGVLYLAEHTRTRRPVALKVFARDWPRAAGFANLKHPNLPLVYRAGTSNTGRTYLAFEYIDGPTITSYCSRESLPVPERLILFEQACRGIEHAHRNGFAHGGLDSDHILVSGHGGAATVKVVGFQPLEGPDSETSVLEDIRALGEVLQELAGEQPYFTGEAVIRKATDTDPSRRYPSIEMLLAGLTQR